MIRDYKVIKLLGKGNYAFAYLVEKKISDIKKYYVIKQIPFNDLSPSEKEEVKKEAKLLSQIKSDFVVKFYDTFEEKNYLNIVMEYCEGGDLEQLLKQRNKIPLNDNFIWKLFIQIVIGLAELHNMKILHRDLKTSNIFLTKNYDIKIGDLGVSKKLSKEDFAKTIIGTPYYLSPEICNEKPYNEKSDIWALGCILYELCTFKHPFDTTNQAALINKILKESPKPIPFTFDYYFNEIIKKLLQKNMNKRPSCKLILKDMHIMGKAKELKLYHKYQKLIEYKTSLSKTRNNKNNLKIGIDENNIHNEKTSFFILKTNENNLNIKTRPRSCSKNKKVEKHILNENKKFKIKKNGIPVSKKNPFANEKNSKIIVNQIKPEINKSIKNRKSSKNKSIKKENKSINKNSKIKDEQKNLKEYLIDTLEMNKNRFNKNEKIIEKDSSFSDKENYDMNSLKNKINPNKIVFKEDKYKPHANLYNNLYESPKLPSPEVGKYSLNEIINDFQSPKGDGILNNLNNNNSNIKEYPNEKSSNSKNDKNTGIKSSAFHIYCNNNQINEKGDNYLSESDEEKYSNQKENQKEEENFENENDLGEERVRTLFTGEDDTCFKNNNNDKENVCFLIEKTKKDLFKLIGIKDY